MAKDIVNSLKSLAEVVEKITEAFNKDRYVTVSINSGKRTLDQNALIHVFYAIIANHETQMCDPIEVEYTCKYRIGLAILSLDPDFDAYLNAIRYHLQPLTYEERIAAMKFYPVTSLMSVAQLTEYVEKMQLIYGEQGIALESNRKK